MSEEKIDRRKQTSKANMAKARAEKLKQLKEQKELQKGTKEYSIGEDSSDSESSDSDDEVLVIKGKGKNKKEKKETKKGIAIDPLQKEINDLKDVVTKLIKENKSKNKKKEKSKTVVQIVNPAPQNSNLSELDAIKKRLLFNMN